MSYIDLFLKESEKRFIVPTSWYRTINIVVPDIPNSKFDLSEELKQQLIDAGEKYTESFFDGELVEVIEVIEIVDEN